MMFWYGEGMGWWGYALMTVSMLLFWGLLIVGVVALVRSLGRSSRSDGPTESPANPEQVLAQRFARGEIDEEEYHGRLAALHGSPRLTK